MIQMTNLCRPSTLKFHAPQIEDWFLIGLICKKINQSEKHGVLLCSSNPGLSLISLVRLYFRKLSGGAAKKQIFFKFLSERTTPKLHFLDVIRPLRTIMVFSTLKPWTCEDWRRGLWCLQKNRVKIMPSLHHPFYAFSRVFTLKSKCWRPTVHWTEFKIT